MKKFTVILLYPDYIEANYGEETFLVYVEADDIDTAKLHGQQMASELSEGTQSPPDFLVLAVFSGHLDDIKG